MVSTRGRHSVPPGPSPSMLRKRTKGHITDHSITESHVSTQRHHHSSSIHHRHQTKKGFRAKVGLSSAISAAASRGPSRFCRRWEGNGSDGRERSWTGHAAPAAAAAPRRTETSRAGCGAGRALSGRRRRSGVGGAVSKIWDFLNKGTFKTHRKRCDIAFFS